MSNVGDTMLKDGSLSFAGGLDQGRPAGLIDPDQLGGMINATARNGVVGPRHGWIKRQIQFNDLEGQQRFQSAYFQGGSFFDGTGNPSLMSSHGGRQFQVDVATFSCQEITPQTQYSTNTTAAFTIPAANASVTVSVLDTSRIEPQFLTITVGGYVFTLLSVVNQQTIQIYNDQGAPPTTVVPQNSIVSFTGYDVNDPLQPLVWTLQAGNYWIMQDNQSYPIIFDGSKAIRSNPAKQQIPVGNVMGYAGGRIGVALPDRVSFVFGDIIGYSSGTAANDYQDSILYFTANTFLNSGGTFTVKGSSKGPITMIQPIAQGDTSLGQGPCLVGCPDAVFSMNLPEDADTWKNLSYPIQTVVPIRGPLNNDGSILVNTDLWYRAYDGFRSYIIAQRQFNGAFGNTPQSNELDDLPDQDTPYLLEQGSGVLFDNRYMHTIAPQQSPYGIYHLGLAVMDFNLSSGLRKKFPPAWEGTWQGPRVLKIVKGVVSGEERCFAWVLSDQSQIEIWEMVAGLEFDQGSQPIYWEPQTKSYNCGDSQRFKKLSVARMIFTGLTGTLTGIVYWRNDEQSCWNQWDTICICAKSKDCPGDPADAPCAGANVYQPQSRYVIRLHEPPDNPDKVANRPANTGYEFQLKLALTGYANLNELRIFCDEMEDNLGVERTDEPCVATPITPALVPNGLLMLRPAILQSDGSYAAFSPPDAIAQLYGQPNKTYTVTLRLRAVIELKAYMNNAPSVGEPLCTPTNTCVIYEPNTSVSNPPIAGGGSALLNAIFNPALAKNVQGPVLPLDDFDEYLLYVSNPQATYIVNNSPDSGLHARVYGLDYTFTIQMTTGAFIRLTGRSADNAMWLNTDPVIVNNGPPAIRIPGGEPLGLGQWVQIDPISIVPNS